MIGENIKNFHLKNTLYVALNIISNISVEKNNLIKDEYNFLLL